MNYHVGPMFYFPVSCKNRQMSIARTEALLKSAVAKITLSVGPFGGETQIVVSLTAKARWRRYGLRQGLLLSMLCFRFAFGIV